MTAKRALAPRTQHIEDRPLPHDLGAEQGLLGCLAVSKEAYPIASETIKPEHFHIGLHAKLYRMMCACYEAEAQSIDPVMLRERLQAQGLVLEPVEREYYDRLLDCEPSALNIGYYVQKVLEAHHRRETLAGAMQLANLAHDPERTFPEVVSFAQELGASLEEESDGIRGIAHSDLLQREVPRVEWIVDGLIPKGGISMLAGEPGVGKSFLCYHLAQCVASGLPFLAGRPVTQCPVLYLDTESTPNLIKRRITKLWNGISSRLQADDIPLTMLPGVIRLDDPRGMRRLKREIRLSGAGLVIIDPLVMVHSLDENSSTEMGKFFQLLQQLTHETGCTILITHHIRKQTIASNQANQRLRGSTAILGFLSSYLFLRQSQPGTMIIEQAKCRDAEPLIPFTAELKDQDESTITLSVGDGKETGSKVTSNMGKFLLNQIAEAGGSLTRAALIERGGEVGMCSKTVDRYARQYVTEKKLVVTRDGKTVMFHLNMQKAFEK